MELNMADDYLNNPFWLRKMRTLYALSHKDPSGKMGIAQAEESIRQIGEATGVEESEKHKADVKEFISQLEIPEGGVDYDSFLKVNETLIKTNKVGFAVETMFGFAVDGIFGGGIDYNKDGVVSPWEYEKFLGCFNANTSKAAECFEYMDKNKNGSLSQTEFHSALVKFYTCLDEEDPSKFVFGPLVD